MKLLISLILSIYIGLFPIPSKSEEGRYKERVVQFISAKKIKTGEYNITVAFLDKDFKIIKDKATGCDSVVVVYGYDTYIIREPIWTKYYTFREKIGMPDMVILWPINELKEYRRLGIPFSEVLYEREYKAE